MMKTFFLLLLFCTQILPAALSQNSIEQFVAGNAHTIHSISISDMNDADLKPIADAIGNARIVMLGEQDHGDAPAFKAKARLIRYLHEQLGFNVLAFESDFFGLTAGYESMRSTVADLDSLLRGNLFPIWTTCVQFSDTWAYLEHCANSNRPLHVAGIDNQLHGAYTAKHLREIVMGLLANHPAGGSFAKPEQERYLRVLDSLVKYAARGAAPTPQLELEWFTRKTNGLLRHLKADAAIDPFTIMALENIRSAGGHMQLYKGPPDYSALFEERDAQMARNLQWLATVKYPTEKIIVWAANGHISKNQYDVEPRKYRHPSLGAYFTKQLGFADQAYVLGFSSFEGTAGRTTQKGSKYQLPAREASSFERWITRPDREYAFVNFRKFNQDNPGFSKRFTMSASNHFQQKGAWHKAFDGVFFIQAMYACDKTD